MAFCFLGQEHLCGPCWKCSGRGWCFLVTRFGLWLQSTSFSIKNLISSTWLLKTDSLRLLSPWPAQGHWPLRAVGLTDIPQPGGEGRQAPQWESPVWSCWHPTLGSTVELAKVKLQHWLNHSRKQGKRQSRGEQWWYKGLGSGELCCHTRDSPAHDPALPQLWRSLFKARAYVL